MSLKAAALSLFLPLLVSTKPSRADIATSLCSATPSPSSDTNDASVQLCRARALQQGSDIDHLATMVTNSLSKGYLLASDGEGEDKLMANGTTVDELVEWTLSLPDGATIQDYTYRLEMARSSLSKPLHEAMTVIASRRSSLQGGAAATMAAKPLNFNAVAPSESDDDGFTLAPEPVNPTDNECAEMCECAEPLKVKGCIDYCERLIVNSIELQRSNNSKADKERYFPHQHYSLLFEGLHDVTEVGASQETATTSMASESMSAVQASINEVAAEAASGGRNKLMTRDSIHLLMMLSLGLGILILLFNFFTQKTFKDDGHFFLPRPKPKRAAVQCNCNKGDAQSTAAASTTTSGRATSEVGGYCAPNMCEEESKTDAVPMSASVVAAPKKRGDPSQVSIKID